MPRPYQEMAERIVRDYKRIPEPGYPNATQEEVWDYYLHFFSDAYHLKDWIVNDSELKIDNKEMNKFINENENLKLLQTIVTQFKHLKADHGHIAFAINLLWDDGSPKPSPGIGYKERSFLTTQAGDYLVTGNGDRIAIERAGKNMHPRSLALMVLVAWNKFFQEKGLEGGFSTEK